MEDQLALLRKSPSVPNFVHTFNIFAKTYLSLPELDILEFEYSLLPPDRKFEDLYDPSTLPNIVIKLLKGCGQAYVREDTCFDILRNLVTRKWHLFCQPDVICPFAPIITPAPGSTAETPPQGEGETVPELNLFSSANPSVDFHSLQSAVKVTCLLVILNSWMMNYLVKINFVDNIEAAILRISPVGMDQRGNKYFYMCGRLDFRMHRSIVSTLQLISTLLRTLVFSSAALGPFFSPELFVENLRLVFLV